MQQSVRKHFLVLLFLFVLAPGISRGQQLGLSFSFFFPRSGYFSIPISPFSFRGLGLNFTHNFSLETGGTLYRMSGMNVTGMPFESKNPVMGPFFSAFVPVQAVLKFPFQNIVFSLKAGGFGFYNLDNHINYGNLDRAIREYQNWDVANADFRFDNGLGYGVIGGAELIVYFTKQFGMNFAVNYLLGGSPLNFRGSYTGGTVSSGLQTIDVNYTDSKLDYTGLEVTMGVLFNTK